MSVTNISEENIVWSGQDFKLSDFVEVYPPPQIVKVEEGYMDDKEEDRSLSSSQVLTLHMVKEVVTVNAIVNHKQRHRISLPVTSSACVEIICKPSYYENVAELARDLPPFVASIEKHPWLGLDANDILKVKRVSESLQKSCIICKNLTSGCDIELPLSYTARFKSLGQCPVNNPTMADITKHCRFPVVVQYLDDQLKVIKEGFSADFPVGIDRLGPLTVMSKSVNKVVITKPWGYDRVLPLPLHLEVRVVAALGALQNDKNYSKLCAIAHNSTDKEDFEIKFIKEDQYKVLLEDKRRESEKSNDDKEIVEYWDVGPPVPSRDFKPNRLRETRSEGDSQSKSTNPRFSRSHSGSMAFEDAEEIPNPDDVFGDNFDTMVNHMKTKLNSVKKAFHGVKVTTKYDFKAFKKALTSKVSKQRDERQGNETPELSHDTPSHALYVPMKGDPAYGEVLPLPSNIQADRYNESFATPSRQKSPSFKCKIRNPQDIRTWTMDEVSECLRYCRLEDYVERFQQEMIDGRLLADLDEDSLESIGVTNKLHILKLMKIIKDGWLPKQ